MLFTPGQLRQLLALPQETFRHWKKAIPSLSHRNGYKPCFSPGDLLALALIKTLVDDGGVRVAALSEIAPQVFELCNRHGWTHLERCTMSIELANKKVFVSTKAGFMRPNNTAFVLVCEPTIQTLRSRLLAEKEGESQRRLGFPPVSIAMRRDS